MRVDVALDFYDAKLALSILCRDADDAKRAVVEAAHLVLAGSGRGRQRVAAVDGDEDVGGEAALLQALEEVGYAGDDFLHTVPLILPGEVTAQVDAEVHVERHKFEFGVI